jgi:hypothetical protein
MIGGLGSVIASDISSISVSLVCFLNSCHPDELAGLLDSADCGRLAADNILSGQLPFNYAVM